MIIRTQTVICTVQILLLAVLLVGCGVPARLQQAQELVGEVADTVATIEQELATVEAGETDGATDESESAAADAAAATPIARPLEAELPRRTRYAGVDIIVTEASITNLVPAPYGGEDIYAPDEMYAVFRVTLSNTLTDRPVMVPPAAFRLEFADETQHRLDTFINPWDGQVEPQSTEAVVLLYAVPLDTTWDGAVLTVGEPGREPALIALDGPESETTYPLLLETGDEVVVQETTYTVLEATLELDARGERVETDKRFVRAKMRMILGGTSSGGVVISQQSFRLLVDGVPLAPLDAPIEALYANSSVEGDVLFVIPASASSAELQVGDVAREETAVIPITLPQTIAEGA